VTGFASHPDLSWKTPGATNVQVLRFEISTVGNLNPLAVQNIKFHDKNTEHISNIRLYYTNTPSFSTTNLIGTINSSTNNILNYDVIPQRTIPHGKHYF